MRRRKVWRVSAGYGVVGWLIIQFATTVFPALALPVWTDALFQRLLTKFGSKP